MRPPRNWMPPAFALAMGMTGLSGLPTSVAQDEPPAVQPASPPAPARLTILASPAPDPNHPSRLFGQGVARFYEGDYLGAIDSFDRARKADRRTALLCYFRGMAAWRIGETGTAEKYFREGAAMEALDFTAPAALNVQMQRLQGPERARLEELRREEKLKAIDARIQRELDVYTISPDSEAAVILGEAKPHRLPPGSDPFADEAGQLAAEAGKTPAEEVPPAGELPAQ